MHVLGMARSTCHRRRQARADRIASEELLLQVSQEHPDLGARKVATMVSHEHGQVLNHKRATRVRAAHSIRAARRGRKRRHLAKGKRLRHRAQRVDEVWSYDFIEDATADARKVRLLSIIDEYSRECLMLKAARSFPATRVIDCLEWLLMTTGRRPTHLRSDNGPEFIAATVKEWLQQAEVQAAYIEPGAPWHGHVESFHASLRAEFLDRELFFDLEEVQVMADDWARPLQRTRPLRALGCLPRLRYQAGR